MSGFFQDDKGNHSSTRLVFVFAAVCVPAIVLIVWAYTCWKSGAYVAPGWDLVGLVGAGGATKVGQKFLESRGGGE